MDVENFKRPTSIFHIILLVISLIYGGLLAHHRRYLKKKLDYDVSHQFVVSTAGGFFIFMGVIFVGICVSEDMPRKTLITAIVFWSILLFLASWSLMGSYAMEEKDARTLVATIFCCLLSLLTLLEAIVLCVRRPRREE